MTTVLSANGLIEIPEQFRKTDALKGGQPFSIERVGQGEYHVIVMPQDSRPKTRLIDVLRSCPVKDWWVDPDRTERTSLEPSKLFEE